jgi:glycosyltransferase involved in cell wall biosynthesis
LRLSKTSIIHAQREDHLFPFILFNKKNPKVCTLHGGSGEKIALKKGKLVGFIYDILGSFAIKHTDKIIAVDESTKEYYLKKYPWLENKIDVIPVGVDLNLFKPMNKDKMRRVYELQSDEKIIVYVGRLEKEKNLEFLLRAFKEINSCQTEYKLLLVGDGRDRKQLEKKAKDMGLTNVIFTGAMNQEKIPEMLNCADVFVLCSLFESGPLVVQEAIACGVPVVTTNVGRVKEFVKDEKVGRIVEYDEFKFSKAIEITIDSISNYNLYRRTIAEKFSFEETMSSLLKIYNNLNNRS